MLTIWIRNTPLSLKKIFFVYLISAIIVLACISINAMAVLFFYLGILATLSIYVMLIAYKNGLYILKKRTANQETYQIRDFLSLSNSRENYREIAGIKNDAIVLSRVFLNQKKPWAFFDLFRIVLAKQKKIKKVLLLGGGGGAVAKTIGEQFPDSKITIVEISKEMIEIANTFFLQKNKNIHLMREDAFAFIKKNTELFDVIIVDLFNGPMICPEVKKNSFVTKIFENGRIILINFGFDYEYISQYTNTYKKAAQKKEQPLHLYLSGKNIIGCNIDTTKLGLSAPRIDNL